MNFLYKLNFPENYQIRLKKNKGFIFIYCIIRNKWILFSHEEWVRQNTIFFLIKNLGYNKINIKLEYMILFNNIFKRADIVVFIKKTIMLLIECKSPTVTLNESVFNQISLYNSKINSKYLMITNGIHNLYYFFDKKIKKYIKIHRLPFRHEII